MLSTAVLTPLWDPAFILHELLFTYSLKGFEKKVNHKIQQTKLTHHNAKLVK